MADVHDNPLNRDEIEAVIDGGEIKVVWQPIVSLTTREVLGYEALSRFASTIRPELVSPTTWFRAATSFGIRDRLEVAAIRSALAELGRVSESAFVALNVSPDTLILLEKEAELDDVEGSRIVLEFAEDTATEAAADEVAEALERAREKGIRIALDDTGSGVVSLRQLLGVNADMIKIDTDITRGIDGDPMKQAMAYSLKSLAERSGATSIAEGVETEGEAEMLASLGIACAQGYLFGRPAPLP
jgi:EAL domain-containing protein (putative c-di-GMP-specific phosphodiesterase class I)